MPCFVARCTRITWSPLCQSECVTDVTVRSFVPQLLTLPHTISDTGNLTGMRRGFCLLGAYVPVGETDNEHTKLFQLVVPLGKSQAGKRRLWTQCLTVKLIKKQSGPHSKFHSNVLFLKFLFKNSIGKEIIQIFKDIFGKKITIYKNEGIKR